MEVLATWRRRDVAHPRQKVPTALVSRWGLCSCKIFRVRVGNHLFSTSGGKNAAAKSALTKDYPEQVNCAVESFASHETWVGSSPLRMWPRQLARTPRFSSQPV